MHVKFHFLKESHKKSPSFMKSGSWRELQSHWIQLKIYLISPYNILSKWWSSFYLRKSHHRNLTTNYAIKKPIETVRDLDSTHLCLSTFQGKDSMSLPSETECIAPSIFSKAQVSLRAWGLFFFFNQRYFTFYFKMCPFVIV